MGSHCLEIIVWEEYVESYCCERLGISGTVLKSKTGNKWDPFVVKSDWQ